MEKWEVCYRFFFLFQKMHLHTHTPQTAYHGLSDFTLKYEKRHFAFIRCYEGNVLSKWYLGKSKITFKSIDSFQTIFIAVEQYINDTFVQLLKPRYMLKMKRVKMVGGGGAQHILKVWLVVLNTGNLLVFSIGQNEHTFYERGKGGVMGFFIIIKTATKQNCTKDEIFEICIPFFFFYLNKTGSGNFSNILRRAYPKHKMWLCLSLHTISISISLCLQVKSLLKYAMPSNISQGLVVWKNDLQPEVTSMS